MTLMVKKEEPEVDKKGEEPDPLSLLTNTLDRQWQHRYSVGKKNSLSLSIFYLHIFQRSPLSWIKFWMVLDWWNGIGIKSKIFREGETSETKRKITLSYAVTFPPVLTPPLNFCLPQICFCISKLMHTILCVNESFDSIIKEINLRI